MRVLVTGGAGFIGSHFVEAARRAAATRSSCSTSSPTRATRRTSTGVGCPEFHRGRHLRHGHCHAGGQGLRRDRQLRRRDSRRPLDPRAEEFIETNVLGTYVVAAVGADRLGITARPGLDGRGVRRRRVAPHRCGREATCSARRARTRPRRPVATAGARGRPHVRRRRVHHPRREHVRPEPVSREDHPADASRTPSTASSCRSTATAARSASGSTSQTTARRSTSSSARARGRGLQRRRRGAREPRRHAAHRRADGLRSGARPARRRPARPRPSLRARRREAPRPRLVAGTFRSTQGLADTVEWYRDNRAWWEPIKSGDFRAYYEEQYASAARIGMSSGLRTRTVQLA